MLLNIKDYQILSCEKNGELFLFNLMLSDKESNTYAVEYVLLSRKVNGELAALP